MQSFKRQKQIQERVLEYNLRVMACMDVFQEAFGDVCGGGDRERLGESYRRIHAAEGAADDIRRDTEVLMYTESLFPESRGDILGLLEAMDRVPNHAESSVRMVLNQHITIPDALCPKITELVDVCRRCAAAMVEAAGRLFHSFLTATVSVGQVDELESEADRLEALLVDQIFSGDLGPLDKILLRDLVNRLAGVADRAESAADRIRIIVAKRSV